MSGCDIVNLRKLDGLAEILQSLASGLSIVDECKVAYASYEDAFLD